MATSLSPKSVGAGATRLPFVPVLVAFFFGGSVFLIFAFPLMVAAFSETQYAGFDALASEALIALWKRALQGTPGSTLIAGAAFFSVVFGFLLKPVDQMVTFTCVLAARVLSAKLMPTLAPAANQLFSPSRFSGADYVEFMSWLLRNKEAKAHWEWEFFLYQIHWSLCTNLTLFLLLASYLLRSSPSVLLFASCASLSVLAVIAYGLARSLVMGHVQAYYERLSRVAPPPSEESPKVKRRGRGTPTGETNPSVKGTSSTRTQAAPYLER